MRRQGVMCGQEMCRHNVSSRGNASPGGNVWSGNGSLQCVIRTCVFRPECVVVMCRQRHCVKRYPRCGCPESQILFIFRFIIIYIIFYYYYYFIYLYISILIYFFIYLN